MSPLFKPTHALIEAMSRAIIGERQVSRWRNHRTGPGKRGIHAYHRGIRGKNYRVGHCGGKQECARRRGEVLP